MFKLKEIQSNSTVVLGGLGSDAPAGKPWSKRWNPAVLPVDRPWRRSTHFFHRGFISYVTGGFFCRDFWKSNSGVSSISHVWYIISYTYIWLGIFVWETKVNYDPWICCSYQFFVTLHCYTLKNLSFLSALAVLWELVFRTLKNVGLVFSNIFSGMLDLFKKKGIMPA